MLSMRCSFLIILLAGLAQAQQNSPYLTYIGGPGDDDVRLVTSDEAGNTFIAGHTNSLGVPFSDELQGYTSVPRIYVMKIDSAGKQVFSRVLGYGLVGGLAADAEGNVFVGGRIQASPDFATPGAFQDSASSTQAFLAKYSREGEKMFATYFGTRGAAQLQALAVDSDGRPVFCGSTTENAVPLTPSSLFQPQAQRPTAYCARMSQDGSKLLFSTLLGSTSANVTPRGIRLDSKGDLLIFGTTLAADFPLVKAIQTIDKRRTLYGPREGSYRSLGGPQFGTVASIGKVGEDVFVGTADSGIWFSPDNGENWKKVPGFWSGVLAVSPLNSRFLCVVTQATQVACSSDHGANWEQKIFSGASGVIADPWVEGGFFVTTNRQSGVPQYLALGSSKTEVNFAEQLGWLGTDRSGDRVWAVPSQSSPALYLSIDRGSTFKKLADNISMVAAAPREPQRLYAARASWFPFKDSLVIVSDDGGVSWRNTALDAPFNRVQQLVVDSMNPQVVYVVQGSSAFVSTDSGASWQPLTPPGLDNLALNTMHIDDQGGAWIGTVGASNGFLMKLNLENPEIQWSTIFGGAGGGAFTAACFDKAGRILLSGFSSAFDLPSTGEELGPRQISAGFAAVIEAEEKITELRFLGIIPAGMEVGPDGAIHIVATANPSNLSETSVPQRGRYGGGPYDAAWLTISPDLSRILQATWLGGSDIERGFALNLGSDGLVRVVGSSSSLNLPVSANALQGKFAQGESTRFGGDGFLAITPIVP